MSYLMKALEKAEQERAKQQEQDLKGGSGGQPVQASLPIGLVVIVVGILIVAVTSAIWMGRSTSEIQDDVADIELEDANSDNNKIADSDLSDPKSASTDELSKADSASMNSASNTQTEVNSSRNSVKNAEPVIAAPPRVYDLVELDTATLNKLPTIRFQGHIYSSAAEYRTVQINDRTLSEGMLLSSGIQLIEITTTGIVISVGNKQVSLPKGQDWIAPK